MFHGLFHVVGFLGNHCSRPGEYPAAAAKVSKNCTAGKTRMSGKKALIRLLTRIACCQTNPQSLRGARQRAPKTSSLLGGSGVGLSSPYPRTTSAPFRTSFGSA